MVFALALGLVACGVALSFRGWVQALLGVPMALYGGHLFVAHVTGERPVPPPYASLVRLLRAAAELLAQLGRGDGPEPPAEPDAAADEAREG